MPEPIDPTKRMPRGAIPTPPSVLAAAKRYVPDAKLAAPASFLMWPSQMSYWGNNKYGDCVSAEEAFAKVATTPYIFVQDATIEAWAQQYGYLNGASLTAVMTTMNTKGLAAYGGFLYDGPYSLVDYTNSATLQNAISSQGPVKLGVAADNFENNGDGKVTPGKSGWAMFNYPSGLTEDHCVSLCGYGNLQDLIDLFKSNNVTVKPPTNMPQGMCYAFFTWNSIGIVDEQSLLNMTYEAWVRTPVTTMNFPSVSALQLKNDGGFVVDIHALYRSQTATKTSEAANHDNFPIAQSRTMNLSEKCTDPAIGAGDMVQLKVWIQWGTDNTYDGLFLYDSNGPTQSFRISGAVHNSSIQYLGPA